MLVIDDTDGRSRVAGHGLAHFVGTIDSHLAVLNQGWPEGEDLNCTLIKQFLGCNIAFSDNLEAAILVDDQVLLVGVLAIAS